MNTSYAQFEEDTILWDLVDHKPFGFYIDVGANDPVTGSVSKSFYDAGWRGINVEPLAGHVKALRAAQPLSTTIRGMCSNLPGVGSMMVPQSGDDGLASGDPRQMQALTHPRWKAQKVEGIPIYTLAEVCKQWVNGQHIDWLKIDVEGMEKQVIEGMDFMLWLPDFLCIEATIPGTNEPTHQEWEPLLYDAGYEFADITAGVNRFYWRK